jgi:hypothetical protein
MMQDLAVHCEGQVVSFVTAYLAGTQVDKDTAWGIAAQVWGARF